MFEFTETILIEAPSAAVWEVMSDIESWWPASNPDHESLAPLDDRGIEVGARIRIREKIAGIPGEAVGEITSLKPGEEVTWEAPHALYRWFGVRLTIGEGVTWSIEQEAASTTRLSAHVWATFPPGAFGWLLERVFSGPLRGIEKDREHTRAELRYLKQSIEVSVNHRLG